MRNDTIGKKGKHLYGDAVYSAHYGVSGVAWVAFYLPDRRILNWGSS